MQTTDAGPPRTRSPDRSVGPPRSVDAVCLGRDCAMVVLCDPRHYLHTASTLSLVFFFLLANVCPVHTKKKKFGVQRPLSDAWLPTAASPNVCPRLAVAA